MKLIQGMSGFAGLGHRLSECAKLSASISIMKRFYEISGWLASGALLVALPKCPACIAGYVMLWTGVGLSFSTATYLRYAALALSIAALLILAYYRIRKTRRCSIRTDAEHFQKKN